MRSIKFISIIFLFTIITGVSYCQNKSDIIKTIRSEFQAINTDSSLKIIELEDDEFLEHALDGGCSLTGYYKKDSLVKVVEWIGLSYGNRTWEFYFTRDKLFFVYEKLESFIIDNKTGEVDHSKTKVSFEGRYYFNNRQLIDQKIWGKRTFEEENNTIAKDLLNRAKEDSQILKRKKKSGS